MPASRFIFSAKLSTCILLFLLLLREIIEDKFDLRDTDSLSDCGPFLVVPTVVLRVSCRVFASSTERALLMASTILFLLFVAHSGRHLLKYGLNIRASHLTTGSPEVSR